MLTYFYSCLLHPIIFLLSSNALAEVYMENFDLFLMYLKISPPECLEV